MKLLYIEDDPVKAYEVQKAILNAGIKSGDITKCSTYPQAEEALDTETFDVIVSDMFYPGADGREVAGGEMIIQKAGILSHTPPVVIISSQQFTIPEAVSCIWYNENEMWEEKLKKIWEEILRRYM